MKRVWHAREQERQHRAHPDDHNKCKHGSKPHCRKRCTDDLASKIRVAARGAVSDVAPDRHLHTELEDVDNGRKLQYDGPRTELCGCQVPHQHGRQHNGEQCIRSARRDICR